MQPIDVKLMRYTLAAVWLGAGVLSLGLFPRHDSLELLGQVGLHGGSAEFALYGAAALDLAMGLLTLAYPARALWQAQAALVISYTAIISVWLPQFWLHPFGPVLKNLPILLLLRLLYKYGGSKP